MYVALDFTRYQLSTMEDVVMPQAKTCLTVKDVCQQLKCSKESVYRYVKAGKLKAAFRLGNRLRFFSEGCQRLYAAPGLQNQ